MVEVPKPPTRFRRGCSMRDPSAIAPYHTNTQLDIERSCPSDSGASRNRPRLASTATSQRTSHIGLKRGASPTRPHPFHFDDNQIDITRIIGAAVAGSVGRWRASTSKSRRQRARERRSSPHSGRRSTPTSTPRLRCVTAVSTRAIRHRRSTSTIEVTTSTRLLTREPSNSS